MKKHPVQMQNQQRMASQPGQPAPVFRGNFKMLVDPQLKKGQQKLIRYNGETYSSENHGQGPVIVRDPRPRTSRLFSRREKVDLPVPRFKIDENYVGPVPPREVTFSKLNDNVTKQFIEQLCSKFGKMERVRVYYHPKTNKHMGLAKVVFSSIKSASHCIETLHQTSIMGNIINAVSDSKGETLKRLHHKIVKGEMIAETMPDVIRHTQEKPRASLMERRRSSQDDPRRRQSTDSLTERKPSFDYGPKTPPEAQSGPRTPPAPATPPVPAESQAQTHDDIPEEQDDFEEDTFLVNEEPAHPDDESSHFAQHPPHPHAPPLHIPPQHQHSFSQGEMTNPLSLESGYGSHPGSANFPVDPVSPFHPVRPAVEAQVSNDSTKEITDVRDKSSKEGKKSKKKHKKKKKQDRPPSEDEVELEPHRKPVWSKDLEHRIDSLLTEQNEKYNLGGPRHKEATKKLSERRYSESSQLSSSHELHQRTEPSSAVTSKRKLLKRKTSIDREDGECSGEEVNSVASDHVEEESHLSRERLGSDACSEPSLLSPAIEERMNNANPLRRSFSRSPPPQPRFHRDSPHEIDRIPPHVRNFERFPDAPGDFHRGRPMSPQFDKYRHPGSPGRRSPGFLDHRGFHPGHFEPRRRSPSFTHHRRHSPVFDDRPRMRSPGFEPRRGRHSPPPFRGRPPSPGFMRRHDFPPNHPEFLRRHSPTFDHRRRSISPPPRYSSPALRRTFDDVPPPHDRHRDDVPPPHDRHRDDVPPPHDRHRDDVPPPHDRFFHRRSPPPDMDRRCRDVGPHFMEFNRHRRRSPGAPHGIYRGGDAPPSPEHRRQRDHRELPPEFLERWKYRRSPSPDSRTHNHPRSRGESPNSRHVIDVDGRIRRRSRSSSPSILKRTPPRIRSPVPLRQDQNPYSPGDLGAEDTSRSAPPDDLALHDHHHADHPAALKIDPSSRSQRESSDHEAPKVSLEERLREMTGEDPPEPDSPSSDHEVQEDNDDASSPDGSIDMEISSGHSGTSSPVIPPNMPGGPFRDGPFRPPFPGMPPQHQGPWNYDRPGGMWSGFEQRMPMPHQLPPWRGPGGQPFHPHHHGNIPNMAGGFPPPHRFPHGDIMRPDMPFNHDMLPPPPPGWNRPWVHAGRPMHPMDPRFGAPFAPEPPAKFNPNQALGDCVLNRISSELKDIIKRDLNRKMIESMAFKVYESWWDGHSSLKPGKVVPATAAAAVTAAAVAVKPATVQVKTEPGEKVQVAPARTAGKLPALLNTFDPLNWAKGSLEMDGFRIGLGLRSAISKMPSFRVKKQAASPVPEKKQRIEDEFKDRVQDDKVQARDADRIQPGRKRIYLDSGGEEDGESDVSTDDEDDVGDKRSSRVPLDVDDVFSSSEQSSSEEESSDEEIDTSDQSDKDEVEEDKDMKLGMRKRRSSDDGREVEPLRKKVKQEDLGMLEGKEKSISSVEPSLSTSDATAQQSKPSSPHAVSPGGSLTPQQLRHVHPKKRYSLLSKSETNNLDLIAEVSTGRLRSDDEMSMMSDKEKAALEILADMKMTPDRRMSSNMRLSDSSDFSEPPAIPPTPGRQLSEGVFSPPVTPALPQRGSQSIETLSPVTPGSAKSPLTPSLDGARQSGSEELQAVEALLSIKRQPPLPPLSPPTPAQQMSKKKSILKRVTSEEPVVEPTRVLTQDDRDKMRALAEEHNYFATAPGKKIHDDSVSPLVQLIWDEHSYSFPPSDAPKAQEFSAAEAETATTLAGLSTELLPVSAAERVKLRREKKGSKRSRNKVVIDERVVDRHREPTIKFNRRSDMDEMSIMYMMWGMGLDLEDMKLLRTEYEDMLTQTSAPQWVNDTHWVPHPITHIADAEENSSDTRSRGGRRRKKAENNPTTKHKSGCARTEGYYKLNDKTKLIQRRTMYRQADNAIAPGSRKGLDPPSNQVVATEKSREARHMMRRIASEFGSDVSDLLKYNQLMFRKKSVKFARSSIHGWGLFAQEMIGADEMVIEYVGELVRSSVADKRETVYTRRGIGSSYLFRIDSDHIIDATKCGNYARFMNHSCNPSCYAKVVTVEGVKKIVIYSKDVIKPQDEITYDYKFPLEDIKIPCCCGAPNCRGSLN